MNKHVAFRRLVAITSIVSMPLALGCLYLSLLAVNFDFAVLENPASSIAVGAKAAGLVYRQGCNARRW